MMFFIKNLQSPRDGFSINNFIRFATGDSLFSYLLYNTTHKTYIEINKIIGLYYSGVKSDEVW